MQVRLLTLVIGIITLPYSPTVQARDQRIKVENLLTSVMPVALTQVVIGTTSRLDIEHLFGPAKDAEVDTLYYDLSGVDYDLSFSFNDDDRLKSYYFSPTAAADLQNFTLSHLQANVKTETKKSIEAQIKNPQPCGSKKVECRLLKIKVAELNSTLYFSTNGEHRLIAVQKGGSHE